MKMVGKTSADLEKLQNLWTRNEKALLIVCWKWRGVFTVQGGRRVTCPFFVVVVVSCVDMSLTTLKHYLGVVLTLCIVPYTCRPATDTVCALLRNPSTRCKRYLVEFQTFVASENTPRFVEWGWLPFSSYYWPVCVYCNDCGHMCIFASWYLVIWRVFLLELTFHTLWYACFFFLLFSVISWTVSNDVFVCHNEKKMPNDWEAWQVTPAIPQVSNSKHTAIPQVSNSKHTAIPQVSNSKHTAIPQVSNSKHTAIPQVSNSKHTAQRKIQQQGARLISCHQSIDQSKGKGEAIYWTCTCHSLPVLWPDPESNLRLEWTVRMTVGPRARADSKEEEEKKKNDANCQNDRHECRTFWNNRHDKYVLTHMHVQRKSRKRKNDVAFARLLTHIPTHNRTLTHTHTPLYFWHICSKCKKKHRKERLLVKKERGRYQWSRSQGQWVSEWERERERERDRQTKWERG